MKALYSDEPIFTGGLSIFLAGPTPRSKGISSWRPEALETLQRLGFEGSVLIPERKDWSVKFDYTDQTEWEYACLRSSTVITFWVPRDMATMPALTTNVEFGFWMAQAAEKVIYGRPENAVSVRYLDWMLKKCTRREPLKTLEETLDAAVKLSKARVRKHTHYSFE